MLMNKPVCWQHQCAQIQGSTLMKCMYCSVSKLDQTMCFHCKLNGMKSSYKKCHIAIDVLFKLKLLEFCPKIVFIFQNCKHSVCNFQPSSSAMVSIGNPKPDACFSNSYRSRCARLQLNRINRELIVQFMLFLSKLRQASTLHIKR